MSFLALIRRRDAAPCRRAGRGAAAAVEALEPRIKLCGTTTPIDPALLERFNPPADATAPAARKGGHHARVGRAAGHRHRPGVAAAGPTIVATNLTTPTQCAEEDNVNVPLTVGTPLSRFSFTVEARHPGYGFAHDSRDADFTHCPASTSAGGGPQETITVYDDHVSTAVVAVRDPNFHQPGMSVRAGSVSVSDVHFVRVIRRVEGSDSWPEVMVLYSDGNLRLKPQAPAAPSDPTTGGDPVFGSSVIVGPAPVSQRPVAGVSTLTFLPAKRSFHVGYAAGGRATLRLVRADRDATAVRVLARYAASAQTPFATVRSMFIEPGNSDVDSVAWAGGGQPIGSFTSAQGGEFLFGRASPSRHNTSGPDIWVGAMSYRLR